MSALPLSAIEGEPTSEVSIVSKDETRSLGFGKPQGE